MKFSGLIKNSFIDFPGLVSCVLFVSGCNYNCFYCHNRSLIQNDTPILDSQEIYSFLDKRKGLIDGLVISGGEPTLQSELIPFIEKYKDMGYKIKLDTNGSSHRVISQLLDLKLCDYYAVDYKAPYNRYHEICGEQADPEETLKTIILLLSRGTNFEVRTTVLPQFEKEDLITMVKELPVLPKYVLNRYRIPELFLPQDKERIKKQAYTQTEIEQFLRPLQIFQPNITT